MSTPASQPTILEVPILISAQIASAERTLREILDLKIGSVVILEQQSDAPVGLYANGKLIAHGEIVASNGNFGVHITNLTQA